jgi:small GTP-binding protein
MKHESAAMVLTPRAAAGGAALAVVRLWGAGVEGFLSRHFSKGTAAGKCVHGVLSVEGRVIDDPVVVRPRDGAWADISLHGGAWIVAAVLELARAEGFEVVEEGSLEASQLMSLAFAEGESLLEREMLAALPLARTELGLRVLTAQPANWRRAFPWVETEMGGGDVGGAWANGSGAAIDLASVVADRSLWWLLHPPTVAIVGAPNVGKSTLANGLFGQTRSITADLPGTTRDWVGGMANIDGLAVELVDTPGVRETSDEIERAAIARSGEKIAGAELIIRVLDAGVVPVNLGRELERAKDIVVVNKIDLLAGWDFSRMENAVLVCARSGAGLGELLRRICGFLGVEGDGPQCGPYVKNGGVMDVGRPRWWTERQKEALRERVESGK